MSNINLLSIIIILTFVCQAICATNDSNKITIDVKSLTLYNAWRTKNLRIFVSEDEKIYRQLIFFESLKLMNEHNANPTNTFKMALTQFSDMTDEEFVEKLLNKEMASARNDKQSSLKPKNDNGQSIDNDDHGDEPFPDPDPVDLPVNLLTSINWQTRGYVSPVKFQGFCGSCWAFSAVGVMESFNQIKNGSKKVFSEQQLVDCVNTSLGYNSHGCGGGLPQHAFDYSIKYGVLQSYQYPYTYDIVAGRCKVSGRTSGYYPKSFQKIANTVIGLKTALNYSPVSVALDASKFRMYGFGIFNLCPSTIKLNHAVLAVGYDSEGNWILKNSKGPNWGESGYIRLKGGNTCGILSSNYRITQ